MSGEGISCMKNRLNRIALLAIACLFILSAYGCSARKDASGEAAPSATASAAVTEPPVSPLPSAMPTQVSAPESPDGETECNWTMEVSDTVTTEVNGYVFTCTLAIMAVKLGGTDELGTYRGLVTLDYQYDMRQGSVAGNAAGGGQEIDAIIELVSYDEQKYDEAAGRTQLAELVEYDAMALGNLILTGSGEANESAGGASWSTGDGKTMPVPYRMAVDGGQVTIELYTTAPGAKFTGMITGTPI